MYKDRPTAAGSLLTASVKGGDAHGVSEQGRNLHFQSLIPTHHHVRCLGVPHTFLGDHQVYKSEVEMTYSHINYSPGLCSFPTG